MAQNLISCCPNDVPVLPSKIHRADSDRRFVWLSPQVICVVAAQMSRSNTGFQVPKSTNHPRKEHHWQANCRLQTSNELYTVEPYSVSECRRRALETTVLRMIPSQQCSASATGLRVLWVVLREDAMYVITTVEGLRVREVILLQHFYFPSNIDSHDIQRQCPPRTAFFFCLP